MIQILVIEDSPVTRLFLETILQKYGYKIIVAKNGKEGISLAHQHQPGLIICNWMMPEVDGLEVCRQIKLDQSLSSTIFVLLTSKVEVEDKVQALNNGADDFLSKPIDESELIASVRSGLRIYKLNRDLELQKQLLDIELTEANEYIRSLLPIPLEGSVSSTAELISSSRLGGDCYDFYWLDPDHLVVYLIDTSGHGVGSALLAVAVFSILNFLRSFSKEKFYEPQIIMTELNRMFQMNKHNGRYFTMWYGIYKQSERKLTYANAGHPSGILFAEYTQVRELPSLDMPIGFFPEVNYTTCELIIPPNSKLYIFSDGIFEVMQEHRKPWGMPKFLNFLAEKFSKCEEINADLVLEKIRSETPNAQFQDDVTLLQINFS